MLLLFVAGLLLVAGFLMDTEPLIQAAGAFQLIGALFLIGRFWRHLAPSKWSWPVAHAHVRMAVIGMIISVALILYLIGQLSSGKEFEEVLNVGLAFDHVNFIMVITNLVLAMMILSSNVSESINKVVFWGVNVGILGFAVGLIAESSVVKRVFTPILGLALLLAIFSHLFASPAEVDSPDVPMT